MKYQYNHYYTRAEAPELFDGRPDDTERVMLYMPTCRELKLQCPSMFEREHSKDCHKCPINDLPATNVPQHG